MDYTNIICLKKTSVPGVIALVENFNTDVETDIICCVSGVALHIEHHVHLRSGWGIDHEFAFSPAGQMKG